MLSFEHLSPTEFEEFSYDLLASLDFDNLNWRKGTAMNASPADQGRDIEAFMSRRDVDGRIDHERWFVECKHYQRGVPPDKISGALAWASAERPHTLLIVTSSFLSNPAKEFLENYERNSRPTFRIKVWEQKDLDNLTAGRRELRQKYGLSVKEPSSDWLSKYHLLYATKPQLNSINYFVELMDGLDPKKRDDVFGMTYHEFIQPRYRQANSMNEKVGDLMLDDVDYPAFRKKLVAYGHDGGRAPVQDLVLSALMWTFNIADKSALPEMLRKNNAVLASLEEKAQNSGEDEAGRYSRMVLMHKKIVAEMPARTEAMYAHYTYVCEHLVSKLLTERYVAELPKDLLPAGEEG